MALRIGLIGGTGLYDLPGATPLDIETPHGPTTIWQTRFSGRDVFFLPRHGATHAHVPLQVPHAAHIHTLRSARCDYVVGINNVGSLRESIRPGSFLVPRDFVDMHRTNRPSWFASEPVHVDFTEPYCSTIRAALTKASRAKEGVYVGVDGPRFETPAEVAAMADVGDVVGMTGVPEAVLAHEAGMCYAALCFVGNQAAGLGARMDVRKIQAALARRRTALLDILSEAVRLLPPKKSCACARVAPTLGVSLRGER